MVYFIRSVLTNMFRLVIRPSSGWCSYYKNKSVVNYVTIRVLHQTDNTSPILWIKTPHITTLVITPQTLNTFTFHDFNNYSFLTYIFTLLK
jgi:hypothetical protein